MHALFHINKVNGAADGLLEPFLAGLSVVQRDAWTV